MAFLFDPAYHKIGKNGVSPFQNMCAYLGGSAIQTVGDNPVTAYRQLVQQSPPAPHRSSQATDSTGRSHARRRRGSHRRARAGFNGTPADSGVNQRYAKDLEGNTVSPKVAQAEANAVFKKTPVSASLSGLWPRLIGVLLKRIPKFGFLLGYSFVVGEGDPGFAAATCASICSAPFINPVRLVEKQQRAFFKTTGVEKPIMEIIGEAKAKNFTPLFRGTIPLMGHSLASATLGLVGQPRLQKWVQKEVGSKSSLSGSATNLIASAVVSPIYVFVTNPLSRLEVIMQTNSIKGSKISFPSAIGEMTSDMAKFGVRGVFRGQGIGIAKAIVSLTLFHEGRMWIAAKFKASNEMKTDTA